MFDFQFGYMYGRYFMWNFVGRQNDEQGNLDLQNGNWLSGIKFIDEIRLGPQTNLPSDIKNNKGRSLSIHSIVVISFSAGNGTSTSPLASMITYQRKAFGLNLLLRVHGSPVFRATIPALLSVGVFLMYRHGWATAGNELDHPYAVGLLIGSITFLIVFRLTQSYGRYWEATTSIYRMMSKWMDAAVHVAGYHMQSTQYDTIKPPSFRQYPDLNAEFLTRDRERFKMDSSG